MANYHGTADDTYATEMRKYHANCDIEVINQIHFIWSGLNCMKKFKHQLMIIYHSGT